LVPESDLALLVEFIGANPEAGDLIPEAGGIRKLRWALPGGGKRGGARVIYFFHNETLPVFLVALYGKNEKANLSEAERNAMAKLVRHSFMDIQKIAGQNDENEETVGPSRREENSHGRATNY
jgi:hypothetical protein